ncbi:hypothetical protein CVT26_001399 [Gymnopilus dilepis]|uniref:Uncharacterized protein n=1 Tax=Gymnopilus dilepis TaxID=231916 RepID=A0A409W7J9_9AGAR|nr:hypothetical protein CVT26_001399 [Gymnopilus dilepis]
MIDSKATNILKDAGLFEVAETCGNHRNDLTVQKPHAQIHQDALAKLVRTYKVDGPRNRSLDWKKQMGRAMKSADEEEGEEDQYDEEVGAEKVKGEIDTRSDEEDSEVEHDNKGKPTQTISDL